MFLLAVIFCSFTASAVVSPPSAYCAVLFVSVFEFLIPVMSSFEYLFYTFLQNSPSVGVCSSLFVFSSSIAGDGFNATGNCALPVEQLVVSVCVCVCVWVWQMATFACIMQKSANGTNVSLGSGPRSAIISYAGKCPAWLFSGEQRRCRREATRRWRMHN